MSTLSSSSTYDEITAAYYDNASYEEDSSLEKAAAFITACRFLLRLIPKRTAQGGRGGNETEFDVTVIRQELLDARRWLAFSTTGSSGVRHVSLADFRD